MDRLGLHRTIVMVVPTYANAVRDSDHLGLFPHSGLSNASMNDDAIRSGLQHFELPVRTPQIKVSAIWHPRDTILAACKTARSANC